MIDKRVLDITRRLVDSDLRLRKQALDRETGEIKGRAAMHGTLTSGATVQQITELACRELRTRTHVGWDILQRVLSDTGVSIEEQLSSELAAWIELFIDTEFQPLARYLGQSLNTLGVTWSITPLQDEAAALKQEFQTRVNLLVLSLQRRASQAAGASTPSVVNFYGTVGSVQTGALSSAAVTQHIGQADIAALSQAIEQLAAELEVAGDFTANNRKEVLEVVTEVKEELRKDNPNSLRVRQLAMGAATAIQTVASLRPAYEALKAVLVPFGVVLP